MWWGKPTRAWRSESTLSGCLWTAHPTCVFQTFAFPSLYELSSPPLTLQSPVPSSSLILRRRMYVMWAYLPVWQVTQNSCLFHVYTLWNFCIIFACQSVSCVRVWSVIFHVWLCNPIDCSPPGSSVHGILQEIILVWVALPSSRASFWPRDGTWISCASYFAIYPSATREAATCLMSI